MRLPYRSSKSPFKRAAIPYVRYCTRYQNRNQNLQSLGGKTADLNPYLLGASRKLSVSRTSLNLFVNHCARTHQLPPLADLPDGLDRAAVGAERMHDVVLVNY